MATGNTNYQIAVSGSGPAYTAFTLETIIRREFENAWMTAAPLIGLLQDKKTNVNVSAATEGQTGSMMLLPVTLGSSATPAVGVADASEFTPATFGRNQNHFHAQYNYAHYRGHVAETSTEKRLVNNKRGNLMEAAIRQEIDSFIDLLATDMASATVDSRTAVLGIQQPLSTSNTVGNISQSTDAVWQSNVFSSYGTFNLDLIDTGANMVRRKNGLVDLILFASTSTNDLYGKLQAQLGSAQRIVDTGMTAKFGFQHVIYQGAACVPDFRLTAGVIAGLSTSSWFYNGDLRPVQLAPVRVPGTDFYDHAFNMFCSLGTNNPSKNWRATGAN